MAGHGHEPGHEYHGDVGEDYNIGTIVTVGVVGCLLCVLVIIWVRALYARSERWEWERKVVKPPVVELVRQQTEQLLRLNSYEWTDPARGFVSIPVTDAIAPTLARLRAEQAQQARSIAPGLVAEGPAAAPVDATEGSAAVPSDGHRPSHESAAVNAPPSAAGQPEAAEGQPH